MNANGPIVIIEDDEDDQELFQTVFKNLNYTNEVRFFKDGEEALEYLTRAEVAPFLIMSDINMPRLDGFALRNKIKTDAALQLKCIPYLFFTTTSNQRAVIDAYSMSVQGFFVKPNSMSELQETLDTILKYWTKCTSPNNF